MNRCLVLLAATILVPIGSGCATTTQVKAGRHDQFRNALAESCRAVNAGDLQSARSHLEDADALATGHEHAAKVADMELVLSGAKAMHDGHPGEAAQAWLAIRDQSLKIQMIALAEEEGMDLFVLAGNRQPWQVSR